MRLILRVDDVGRKPKDEPEYGTDHDLSYFAIWRYKAGLAGLPVVYGVVHQWLHPSGVSWLKNNIRYPEKVAVHGWDHKRGKEPTPLEMATTMDNLTTDSAPYSYIPPFNAYTSQTLQNWQAAGGRYFFGGLNGTNHAYGEEPIRPPVSPKLIHLSADHGMYDHAPLLLGRFQSTFLSRKLTHEVRVVTLHVPWDKDISVVGELVSEIRDSLVSVDTLLGEI